jgi:hypothetical protein
MPPRARADWNAQTTVRHIIRIRVGSRTIRESVRVSMATRYCRQVTADRRSFLMQMSHALRTEDILRIPRRNWNAANPSAAVRARPYVSLEIGASGAVPLPVGIQMDPTGSEDMRTCFRSLAGHRFGPRSAVGR